MTDTSTRTVRRHRTTAAIAAVGLIVGVTSGRPGAQSSVLPGPMVIWGSDALAKAGPPAGDFMALADGGALQTFALRPDGTMYLSGGPNDFIQPIPSDLLGVPMAAIGMGRNHALAIRPDGSIVSWGHLPAREGTPDKGPYIAVTGSAAYSVALDTKGRVVMWGGSELGDDYEAVVGVGAPAGLVFTAISARARYTLALSAEGDIYGWGAGTVVAGVFDSPTDPWTPDESGHYRAPAQPANPYVAMSAGLDVIVALRADGTAILWETSGRRPPAPAGVRFTRVAAGRFAAGIDREGRLHAWGSAAGPVPAGRYSYVSAATGHVSAIAVPGSTPPVVSIVAAEPSIGPANHRMVATAVTFRAEDPSAPVLPSGLSVSLRSSQPDNGFASGNTTGDTNGGDGYMGAVHLPASAIVQNPDGSFTATFHLRAEEAAELSGPRRYVVSIVAANSATPSVSSLPASVGIVVRTN